MISNARGKGRQSMAWTVLAIALAAITLGCSEDGGEDTSQFCDEYASFATEFFLAENSFAQEVFFARYPGDPDDTLVVGEVRGSRSGQDQPLGRSAVMTAAR